MGEHQEAPGAMVGMAWEDCCAIMKWEAAFLSARSATSVERSNSEQPSVNETAPTGTKIDGTPPNG